MVKWSRIESSSKEDTKSELSDFYTQQTIARCHCCSAEVHGKDEKSTTLRLKFLKWKIDGKDGLICNPCQELKNIGFSRTD